MSHHGRLAGLIDTIEANLGRKPNKASADAGYLSEANLAALTVRGIAPYIATGRAKHPSGEDRPRGGSLAEAMRRKLKRAGWRTRYRLRKQIVEPVFGQIKPERGLPPVAVARRRRGECQVGDDLHRRQPRQVRQGHLSKLFSSQKTARAPTQSGS